MNDSVDCGCAEKSWSAGSGKIWKYLPSQRVSILIASNMPLLHSIVYWTEIQRIPNWECNPVVLQGADVNSQRFWMSSQMDLLTETVKFQVKWRLLGRPPLPISFHIASSYQLWFIPTWQWCHYQGDYQWCHFKEQMTQVIRNITLRQLLQWCHHPFRSLKAQSLEWEGADRESRSVCFLCSPFKALQVSSSEID